MALSREVTVLIRHPPMLRCTVVVSIYNQSARHAAAAARCQLQTTHTRRRPPTVHPAPRKPRITSGGTPTCPLIQRIKSPISTTLRGIRLCRRLSCAAGPCTSGPRRAESRCRTMPGADGSYRGSRANNEQTSMIVLAARRGSMSQRMFSDHSAAAPRPALDSMPFSVPGGEQAGAH
jgi:hypothetical protein